tara:strand:+ start:471 stop:1136 length:666 start_codon:yes stop_codon:yes gene_type:complete
MIRLSVDTSFDHVGLCLTREGKPVANYYSLCKRRNSKIIFQIIDEIFRNTNITLAEVDAYVINCGPGSYTGVRIGMAIVKTFAQVNKKPIIQVNSIELLANQIYHFKEPFYVVLNCNRGEIFYSKFKILDHQPSSQTPIKMTNIGTFHEEKGSSPVVLYRIYPERNDNESLFSKLLDLPRDYPVPDAFLLDRIGEKKMSSPKFDPNLPINPLYIKRETGNL